MKNLHLHPRTLPQLELLLKREPQAVILHGKNGVGLYTVANKLAKTLSNKHNILHISPDEKNNIKIDVIRQLYTQTRTKRFHKLIVLIDDADAMLAPAQNALLKLLEDTPKNSIFLLTTHQPQMLLPTIRSRTQYIEILPVTSAQTKSILQKSELKDTSKHAQLLFLGSGLPAELHRLTHSQEYLALRIQQMKVAKDFLSAPLYKKLVIIYKSPSERVFAYILIQDLMHITETMLKSQTDSRQAILLHSLLQTEEKLKNDGHVRTQLMNLAVSIS